MYFFYCSRLSSCLSCLPLRAPLLAAASIVLLHAHAQKPTRRCSSFGGTQGTRLQSSADRCMFFSSTLRCFACRSPRRGSNTFTAVTTKIITTRTWDYKTRCFVLGHCTFGVGQSGAAATLAVLQLAIDFVRNSFPSCRNTASAHCKDTPARGHEAA
jgi:hypothetical protein